MSGLMTIGLLIVSNIFMTLAWYGHLKFEGLSWFKGLGLFSVILISWGIAFFEYCVMVPANRGGYIGNGGIFSLVQLKLLQEVITLIVFGIFVTVLFKNETFKWNHLAAALCLLGAVYFTFKK